LAFQRADADAPPLGELALALYIDEYVRSAD
jgi:hypothetical protein